MKCPADDTTLAIADRQGIEIDYCPTCRGVWLDRGELDKLIDRENRWVEDRIAERDDSRSSKHDAKTDAKPAEPKKKKKMSSLLSDLMEFGQQ